MLTSTTIELEGYELLRLGSARRYSPIMGRLVRAKEVYLADQHWPILPEEFSL